MTDHSLVGQFESAIGELFLRLLQVIGLAMGGGQASAASELDALQRDSWRLDPDRVLTPATLAELVVKGAIDEGYGASEAQESGINEGRFGRLVAGTGNPPGPETIITMLRRRIIGGGDAEKGLRQGYLKNEWIAQYLALIEDLPTTGELVAGVVQNHIDRGAALDLARQAGVRETDFDLYVENAGNPPGPMEVLNLWNRGEITEAEVDQALRESRLKDKYIAALKRLAIRKVPLRSITTLLNHGAIDDNRAVAMLRELGYSQEDAAALVAAAHKTSTAAHKEVSASQVRQLYADQIIPRDQAGQELVAMGYSAVAAGELLDLADAEADRKLRTATISKLHTLFVAHHLDATAVSTHLDNLLVPAGQRDRMITLWSLEESANVRELTEAQTISAAKKRIITVDEAGTRLAAMGYNDGDVLILLQIAGLIAGPTTGG